MVLRVVRLVKWVSLLQLQPQLKGSEANWSAVLIAKEYKETSHMRAKTKKILKDAKLRQCEH